MFICSFVVFDMYTIRYVDSGWFAAKPSKRKKEGKKRCCGGDDREGGGGGEDGKIATDMSTRGSIGV